MRHKTGSPPFRPSLTLTVLAPLRSAAPQGLHGAASPVHSPGRSCKAGYSLHLSAGAPSSRLIPHARPTVKKLTKSLKRGHKKPSGKKRKKSEKFLKKNKKSVDRK